MHRRNWLWTSILSTVVPSVDFGHTSEPRADYRRRGSLFEVLSLDHDLSLILGVAGAGWALRLIDVIDTNKILVRIELTGHDSSAVPDQVRVQAYQVAILRLCGFSSHQHSETSRETTILLNLSHFPGLIRISD